MTISAASSSSSDARHDVHDVFDMASITVVELHMMDKRKYFPLTLLSGFTIRSFLYPFSLIKTRLQLQRRNTIYTSLYDAFRKTVVNEGVSGLYRGFWVGGSIFCTSWESCNKISSLLLCN